MFVMQCEDDIQPIVVGETLITREFAASLIGVKPNTLAVWAVKRWYDKWLPVTRTDAGGVRYGLSDVLKFPERRGNKKRGVVS